MRRWIGIVMVLAGISASVRAQEAQTPESPRHAQTPENVLATFRKEMLKVLKNSAMPKDVRDASVAASKSIFDKEIGTAVFARPGTVEQGFVAYLKNLADSRPFAPEAFASERQQWFGASAKVLEVAIKSASDKDDARTTQQCYDLLVTRVTRVSKQFPEDPALRGLGEQGAKKIFDDMVTKASNPSGTDFMEEFTRNVSRADSIFPQKSDSQRKFNGSSNALLKEASKRCLDRAKESSGAK